MTLQWLICQTSRRRSALRAAALSAIFLVPVGAQNTKQGQSITDWVLMAETADAKLYYSSIARDGDAIKVWFKVEALAGSRAAGFTSLDGPDYGEARACAVLRCGESRIKTGPALVLYYNRAGHLAKSVKEHENVTDPALAPLFTFFCEQGLDKKPLTAPQLKSKP
jgi:hypothetical protein